MRIIDDETVQAVVTMEGCMAALERAYRELAQGSAVNHPRQRYKVDGRESGRGYIANMLAGAVPAEGVAALRYDSMVVERASAEDEPLEYRYIYPQRRSYGFVLLFSIESGELLAAIADFSLSAIRVAATPGVAARRLARADARTLMLYGSGNEARRHAEALCAVRPIEAVYVYSPKREHRERFVREMSERVGIPMIALEDPHGAIAQADIVMSATSSTRPVFDGTRLRAGQLVCSIANSDRLRRRDEVDQTTVLRAKRVVVNHRATLFDNDQREVLDLIDAGQLPKERIVELGEVLAGKAPGRDSDDDLIYYKANSGMGIQFAAAGAAILRECEERGLGRVIPSEWFATDVGALLDRGFNPSP